MVTCPLPNINDCNTHSAAAVEHLPRTHARLWRCGGGRPDVALGKACIALSQYAYTHTELERKICFSASYYFSCVSSVNSWEYVVNSVLCPHSSVLRIIVDSGSRFLHWDCGCSAFCAVNRTQRSDAQERARWMFSVDPAIQARYAGPCTYTLSYYGMSFLQSLCVMTV